MPDLNDGERVSVQGSGTNRYVLARDGLVYSCTCPAWRNMRMPIRQRRCKHLVAYLNDAPLAMPRGDQGRVPSVPALASKGFEEPPTVRARREEILHEAVESHVVLFDRMEEVFGLRLPKEVAYAAGFILALEDRERDLVARHSVQRLAGVTAWFDPNQRRLSSTSDARLTDRSLLDAPELVVAMVGVGEARYCLLYDDPTELPAGVVIREGSRTRLRRPTLLATLTDEIGILPVDPDPAIARRRDAVLAWLAAVWQIATPEIETSALTFQRVAAASAELTIPYVPGWSLPSSLFGDPELARRMRAYSEGDPGVAEWVDVARRELADGSPGRALFLGREMHMSGSSHVRAAATELLIRAYAMLGRSSFIEIVRAQHVAMYPEVELYESPPPHPISNATSPLEVTEAWSLSPPTEADVEDALKRAPSVEIFDAIFSQMDEHTRPRVTRAVLSKKLSQLTRLPPGVPERATLAELIGRLIDRTAIDARSFERIVATNDLPLVERAASTVDLTEHSQQRTPLHVAAGAALPTVVAVLLDRGADARAKNARGRWPFDDALAALHAHPKEAHAVMRLLEARGGAVGKVPSLPSSDADAYRVGDHVHHTKFGRGVITAIMSGDEPKLQVRFESSGAKGEPKTLLAKFVSRD